MNKGQAINTFSGGLVSDLNAITTPNTVLTDVLNGTTITFNGNELVLQNDMGNTEISIDAYTKDSPKVSLSEGFIPVGIKEHGGIIYIVSHNPSTLETEIGSFPGPNFVIGEPYTDTKINTNTSIVTTLIDSPFTSNITQIGKVITLTDTEIKPGDHFVLEIPITESLSCVSGMGTNQRKYYSPRLVNIDSNNRDITDKFERQDYLGVDGVVTKDNPHWFLPKTMSYYYGLADLRKYIDNSISQVYPFDLKRGKLGIKFDLEDIDLFRVSRPESVLHPPAYYPVFDKYGTDATTYKYKVTFQQFEVIQESSFLVDKVTISYKLYNNLFPTVPTLVVDNSVMADNLGNPNYSDPVAKIKILDITDYVINIPDKNYSIEYTITPWDTRYGRSFDNHVRTIKIDLSKDEAFWESAVQYALVSKYSYGQKIDGDNANESIEFDLKKESHSTGGATLTGNITSNQTLTTDKYLKNSAWVKSKGEISGIMYDIISRIYANIDDAGSTHSYSYDGWVLLTDSTSITIDTSTKSGVASNPDPFSWDMTKTYTYTGNASKVTLGLKLSTYYAEADYTLASWDLEFKKLNLKLQNSTGHTISPVIGKYQIKKGFNVPISTYSGTVKNADLNTNDELWPDTPWIGQVSPVTFKSSFKKLSDGFNRIGIIGALGRYGEKRVYGLVRGIYYALSFYSDNPVTISLNTVELTPYTKTTLGLHTIYFLKNNDNEFDTIRFSGTYTVTLSNISIREKLVQDLITPENYQDVACYKEDVPVVWDDTITETIWVEGTGYTGTYPANYYDSLSNNSTLLYTFGDPVPETGKFPLDVYDLNGQLLAFAGTLIPGVILNPGHNETTATGGAIFRNTGIYLPYPNCNYTEFFTLDSTFTKTTFNTVDYIIRQ